MSEILTLFVLTILIYYREKPVQKRVKVYDDINAGKLERRVEQ